jgi:hypothetical protein
MMHHHILDEVIPQTKHPLHLPRCEPALHQLGSVTISSISSSHIYLIFYLNYIMLKTVFCMAICTV